MAHAIYTRFKSFSSGPQEPFSGRSTMPYLSAPVAAALLVAYAVGYVLPFYASATTRPSTHLSRDAPSVIRARIRSVCLSCGVCSLVTYWLLARREGGTPSQALHLMGLWPVNLVASAQGLALTALLFLGPLFEAGIVDRGWHGWIRLHGLDEVVGSWIGWRNLVAGPVTEEVLFRSASIPILLISRVSARATIFLVPVIFGLAHIHHFYEFRISHPHTSIAAAVVRSLVQFAYTSVFGSYVSFLYLRSGSLLNVVLVHAFCNWMGFPRLWGRLDREELPDQDLATDTAGRDSAHATAQQSQNSSLAWTVAYYVLLVSGATIWYHCLWSWTESPNALAHLSRTP